MDFEYVRFLIAENAVWAASLAGALFALTTAAGSLLHPDKRDTLALWLMGANETTWSRSFCEIFDAVFGKKHTSLGCILRSAIASLISVLLIWLVLGEFNTVGIRIQSDLTLGVILPTAIVVNVVADYLSLLETRWLLQRMDRIRSVGGQALVLLLDLVISGLIIWVAIVLLGPLVHEGKVASFAEILGVFSMFSVLFYSTFLTSVWTWAYVCSTWLVRLVNRRGVANWLNIEQNPVAVLGGALTTVVFVGALALSVLTQVDDEGVSLADRALCTAFPGEVCVKVAGLTESEQLQTEFIIRACEGGMTEECLERAQRVFAISPFDTARLNSAACGGGNVVGCTNLGWLRTQGLGVDRNEVEAARLYAMGCQGKEARACNNLGILYLEGRGVDLDLEKAVRLHKLGCDGGSAEACTNLATSYWRGRGVEPDKDEAAKQYRIGCEGGSATGCTTLGRFHMTGFGVRPDDREAARLYRKGCDGGDALGCSWLGRMHALGRGIENDLVEAARLFKRGCEGGDAGGCRSLGWSYANGDGLEADLNEAARMFNKSCEGGDAFGCRELERLLADQ